MSRSYPSSPRARQAFDHLEALRDDLVAAVQDAASVLGPPPPFVRRDWLRDGGRHGGGDRLEVAGTAAFDRATANLSAVHYEDLPDRPLASATALSCIFHPAPPRAPSMHMHASCTELRTGRATWRLMADLNPSQPDAPGADAFREALRAAAPDLADRAFAEGDRYFFIPALGRHRGVVHFYVEGHATSDPQADLALAERVVRAATLAWVPLVAAGLPLPADPQALAQQRAYHTLYAFQVLTLDRGTTSGLLVHEDNDAGVLGSLPSRLDPALFASWREAAPTGQRALIDRLLATLDPPGPHGLTVVDQATRIRLARALRAFYREHPEALELQARGSVLPPTVANHLPKS